MTVATFTQPDFSSQNISVVKANIEACIMALGRIAGAFAPHEQDTPDMTVRLDAGFIPKVREIPTEVAAQSTGTITAPSGNPRLDIVYIDRDTGVVGVATGTEAGSPSDPELSDNQIAIARVTLATDTAEITNDLLDDLRNLQSFGADIQSEIAGDVFFYQNNLGAL